MRNSFFVFSLVFLAACRLSGQGEPRFYAEADLVSVETGQPVQITFTLENGKSNARFTPPDWEAAGFMLLGSSQSSSISISNGETSVSATYLYNITPRQEGEWTVPSVSIKSGSEVLKTEPIRINALPGDSSNNSIRESVTPRPSPNTPKKKIKTIKM